MRKKRGLALLLSAVMAFSIQMPQVYAGELGNVVGPGGELRVPGTTKVEKDYDETFLSVTGFGAEGVQDRSHYYDEYVANGMKDTANYRVADVDCYMDEDFNRLSQSEYDLLEPTEQANYKWVTSEEQFCRGVAEARVVEIRQDLELGFKYLEENNIANYGVITPVTDYDKGNEPVTNPVLMEVGVSSLNLPSHITIFSPNGSVLEHAGISLNKVEDVVIRNIQIRGLYEFDDVPVEMMSSAPGGRKRYGWCNISCNNAKGVWIDHCTLGYAFDGNVDLKNDSQVSITWTKVGVQEDIDKVNNDYQDADLWKCIEYMEADWQKEDTDATKLNFKIYGTFRDNGATPEQIFKWASMHSKVHLVGSGEDDYETNPLNALTLAYNQYHDTAQRIPMVRQGNAHMYNCYFNAEDYLNAVYNQGATFREALSKVGEFASTYGLNRAMDARDGASIAADTCMWDGYSQAIIGGQKYTSGRFKDCINYLLIVNSSLRHNGQAAVYTGSNYDNNGNNEFLNATRDWKADGHTYIEDKYFQWSEWKPMTKVQSEATDGVTYLPESVVEKMEEGQLYRDYYIGRDELGYDYQTVPLEDVKTVTDANSGAGKVTLDDAGEWTKLYYGTDADEYTVSFEDAQGEFEGSRTLLYKADETLGELPVPTRTGYSFEGWYIGEIKDGEFCAGDTKATPETVVTGDMVLYSSWEVAKYTVTFDSTGGSAVEPLTNVEHGQSFRGLGLDLPETARDGFTFQGWYDSFDKDNESKPFGAKLLKGSAFTENCTFYAKWKATKVDLIFNSNGGSEVQPMLDLNINATTGLPEAPTKDGYQFAGWYYDEALTKEFVADSTKLTASLSYLIDIDGELNLYAKWEEINEVTLTFDPMGGTTPDAIKVTPAAAVSELPESTRPEYVFAGWYTDNTDYETEFTTSSAIEADTTVYAKWVKKGDVNGDDVADALDALEILKGVAGMLPQSFTPLQMKQADVEADGSADALDALKILKVVAGMIPGFDA